MVHFPKEIIDRIFSYDPTYKILFNDVLRQFMRCSYCRYDKRVEFEYDVSVYQDIQKNFSSFQYCSLHCMVLTLRQKKDDPSLPYYSDTFFLCDLEEETDDENFSDEEEE